MLAARIKQIIDIFCLYTTNSEDVRIVIFLFSCIRLASGIAVIVAKGLYKKIIRSAFAGSRFNT